MSGRNRVLKPRLSSSRQPCSRRSVLMLLAGATIPIVSPARNAGGLIQFMDGVDPTFRDLPDSAAVVPSGPREHFPRSSTTSSNGYRTKRWRYEEPEQRSRV